jgi:hypothetical protein
MAPRISYQIQVISTDPDLNADPTRRLPTASQARYVKARDQHCVHPGCRATRTEHDHTTAHTSGGPTLTKNLALRCPKHHRIKHLPGWSATQDPDGIDPPTERVLPPRPAIPAPDESPPF